IGSVTGLLLLSGVLIIVATAIAITMGRPVLFRQTRSGKAGRPFDMIKFRSMQNTLDAAGQPLPDAARITRLGRFLRASSLDELPELWNVVKGDMSLVGPRPLLMEYLPLYSTTQARRSEVRPGITGWAQVNGRNALGWEQKFALDVWYVDHWTLMLDLKIIVMTIGKVLMSDGITAKGEATMQKFTGDNK
ncbi:sugar transferase, partial [Yoonia sp.]|uniref:sugar transferase n=1 Tax=Yoonia sp. TaxID=2212373 RepID=UPI0025E641D6